MRSRPPAFVRSRSIRTRRTSLVDFVVTAVCGLILYSECAGRAGAPSASFNAADLVLRGGAIYTVDAARTWAEAVAIRDEKIVYVGSDAGAQHFVGSNTAVVDLGGAMVVPGFQDAHIHTVWSGITRLTLSLLDLDTKEEYVEAIAAYAAANPTLPWITGGGWSMSAFPNAIPDGSLIDAVVSDRPVSLSSVDGHARWVNSKALEAAGITRDTPDPKGGRIDRDPQTGEPVGGLQERPAMDFVSEVEPPITAEQAEAALREALRVLNGFGITSFQEASMRLEGKDAYTSLNAYRALDQRGELTARVVASLRWTRDEGEEQISRLLEARDAYTGGRLRANTVKIMQDGVMENQTAVLLEPYLVTGGRGVPRVEPEALKSAVTRLDAEGFQVHFHGIGDAAIRQCLDSVEAARHANGGRDARHHISHLQLLDPEDIPRFRELGVIANFQPLWAYEEESITELTLPFIGPERGRWIYPIASFFQSGVIVAFGSDWDVSSPNPLEEMETAITRKDALGISTEPAFIPEQRIGLHDAIAAFTINAAYVNHQEDRTGSIEVGKLADLAVLDRNLFDIEPSEISDAEVLLTLLGGQPVHGDLSTFSARGGLASQ